MAPPCGRGLSDAVCAWLCGSCGWGRAQLAERRAGVDDRVEQARQRCRQGVHVERLGQRGGHQLLATRGCAGEPVHLLVERPGLPGRLLGEHGEPLGQAQRLQHLAGARLAQVAHQLVLEVAVADLETPARQVGRALDRAPDPTQRPHEERCLRVRRTCPRTRGPSAASVAASRWRRMLVAPCMSARCTPEPGQVDAPASGDHAHGSDVRGSLQQHPHATPCGHRHGHTGQSARRPLARAAGISRSPATPAQRGSGCPGQVVSTRTIASRSAAVTDSA